MYRIERINDESDFEKFNQLWNSLLSQSEDDSVLLTHEWFSCWWRAYGAGMRMMILLIWNNDELVAIAPFALHKGKWRGIPVKKITLIANVQSNRSGLIIKDQINDVLVHIIEYFYVQKIQFDIFQLYYICDFSISDINIKEMLEKTDLRFRRFINNRSPYVPIKGKWEEYRKSRTKNLKHKLNRIENLFRRDGDFKIEKYETLDIEKALGCVYAIALKSWKHERGSSIASKEKEKRFYRDLALAAAKRGWLNIWILKHKEKPISFIYNLIYKKRIYSLKIGFDMRYSKYSPGEYLIQKAISDSFEKGLIEYDWLGTNLPFKMKWADSIRNHHNYIIFNNTMKGHILAFLEISVIARFMSINYVNALVKFLKKLRKH